MGCKRGVLQGRDEPVVAEAEAKVVAVPPAGRSCHLLIDGVPPEAEADGVVKREGVVCVSLRQPA